MHPGNGPGLTPRRLGQAGGTEQNFLSVGQLPSHDHDAVGTVKVFDDGGDQDGAAGHNFSNAEGDVFTTNPTNATMTANNVFVTVGNTGGGQGVNNIPPFECVNFIIALQGTFPSRN